VRTRDITDSVQLSKKLFGQKTQIEIQTTAGWKRYAAVGENERSNDQWDAIQPLFHVLRDGSEMMKSIDGPWVVFEINRRTETAETPEMHTVNKR